MLFKCLIVLVAVTTVLGSPAKIIGGTQVIPGEIPFQVSIKNANGVHKCGGVIVGDKSILTVASCISNLNFDESRVVTGIVDVNDVGIEHIIETVIIHPNYTQESPITVGHNDLAIIQVSPNFQPSDVTQRAVLSDPGYQIPDGTVLSISGWGDTSFGGSSSNLLLRTEVATISDAECAEIYADHVEFFTIDPEMICAGVPEGGKDGCEGDDGGPMFSEDVVYGIFIIGAHCGSSPGKPGIYVEVSAYRDWIDANNV